jgi:hypothetical protein
MTSIKKPYHYASKLEARIVLDMTLKTYKVLRDCGISSNLILTSKRPHVEQGIISNVLTVDQLKVEEPKWWKSSNDAILKIYYRLYCNAFGKKSGTYAQGPRGNTILKYNGKIVLCENCGSHLEYDVHHGEFVCIKCGLIRDSLDNDDEAQDEEEGSGDDVSDQAYSDTLPEKVPVDTDISIKWYDDVVQKAERKAQIYDPVARINAWRKSQGLKVHYDDEHGDDQRLPFGVNLKWREHIASNILHYVKTGEATDSKRVKVLLNLAGDTPSDDLIQDIINELASEGRFLVTKRKGQSSLLAYNFAAKR